MATKKEVLTSAYKLKKEMKKNKVKLPHGYEVEKRAPVRKKKRR